MSELKRAIEEHKKCPCCDSENIEVGSVAVSFGEDIFIKCNSCGIKLQICKEYGWGELLKRWNTRKPMDRIVERLEDTYQDRINCAYHTSDCFIDGQADGLDKALSIVKEEGEMNEL